MSFFFPSRRVRVSILGVFFLFLGVVVFLFFARMEVGGGCGFCFRVLGGGEVVVVD